MVRSAHKHQLMELSNLWNKISAQKFCEELVKIVEVRYGTQTYKVGNIQNACDTHRHTKTVK